MFDCIKGFFVGFKSDNFWQKIPTTGRASVKN